ncbi:hypothetical protein [Leucobacter ruminantium]|uniref:Uncharacterized protein n=1 Tax=Leucobacter ruminantium TaxID=1289170 RepID=A0A939RY45_9MICO|nr:hypothetical protein [Leucobacter ruminantium]MBO1804486.1 hypothetical protein [Leucobacter ruminantium]
MHTTPALAAAGEIITVSGYPLVKPVTIEYAYPDTENHGTGWLLSISQAVAILDAWKHAPRGDSDVVREWCYSAAGLFVTALYIDGDVVLSLWESAAGSDGTDRYATATMPFDFETTEATR